MKSWEDVEPDEYKLLTKHYTPGRGGRTINKVIIHHNAGTLSIQQCYDAWQTREASAQYQVDVNGRVGQLVHDWDTSWNAGNWDANQTSIGIEHANSSGADQGWPVSAATRETGAHLVAALCRRYGLGRPAWGVNVFPHQHFQSTACPGVLYGAYRDSYMARAQEWYDAMVGGTAPAPAPAAPAPAPAATAGLVADGYWGTATTRRAQEVLGTPVDGVVSSQDVAWASQNPALTGGWEWTASGTAVGSQLIRAMQQRLGVTVDGLVGPATIRALQSRMGTPVDGHLDEQSSCVIALQTRLNAGRF